MTTQVHATVAFTVPDLALREGEETFRDEMRENLEFWFEIPVEVAIDLTETEGEGDAESTKRADIDLYFDVPGEENLDLGGETVENIIRDDIESFFDVPITLNLEEETDEA